MGVSVNTAPAPATVPTTSASQCFLPSLPPELRSNIYAFLLLDLQASFSDAAVEATHTGYLGVRTDLINGGHIFIGGLASQPAPSPTSPQHLSARPSILQTHPLIRHEFSPLYRAALAGPVWHDFQSLLERKAERYLELHASGYHEPRARDELCCLAEFRERLASWIVRELATVGLEQLSLGERVCCGALGRMWKRKLVEGKEGGDKGEEVRRMVEGMRVRVRSVERMVGAYAFGKG
ncbi:hypothetical protein CLAFUW4_11005 [Fulvia fulva]|uniref:Uncharacterized protein n=1 Tax=Passalora fulva TaxID=5499 RepID=A0A9Q8PDK2_PASFU|nr:uncharacterized protein CLAFUR5_10048 [Fulvia fulva]KAK4619814.1 hypothetical protein CLAFUR4_11010 [Fulvia fulva]KAK4620978.1 hypothetical protein CLAFUR0_11017 [Fulvia fulva]UJO20494.1 hypothetical protein CLAFUR5_10048 [Fulvia fulva]WPV17545.1 hypothetical protein CLAFUW4_11005 [Fulvia fulva]WPV32524.1 hypothetical protein CLAFUW7_11003 [Fulvia fulva]